MKPLPHAVALVLLLAAGTVAEAGNLNPFDRSLEVHVRDGKPVDGNGEIVTVRRELPPYRRIDLQSAENLSVRIVAGAPSTQLRGESNLLDRIATRVQGDTLIVEATGSYRTRNPIVVEATLPALDGVAIEGSSNARIDGLDAERFKVEISGSGDVEASGRAKALEVELDGSGNAALRALATQRAEVEINGSGNITVQVSERLKAEINGSGDIRYAGDPPQVKAEVNGSGKVKPL